MELRSAWVVATGQDRRWGGVIGTVMEKKGQMGHMVRVTSCTGRGRGWGWGGWWNKEYRK